MDTTRIYNIKKYIVKNYPEKEVELISSFENYLTIINNKKAKRTTYSSLPKELKIAIIAANSSVSGALAVKK
jgi:hypothetical protein